MRTSRQARMRSTTNAVCRGRSAAFPATAAPGGDIPPSSVRELIGDTDTGKAGVGKGETEERNGRACAFNNGAFRLGKSWGSLEPQNHPERMLVSLIIPVLNESEN